MFTFDAKTYSSRVALMFTISVLAWAAFATVFRLFWPGQQEPGGDLTLFWTWMVLGSLAFVAAIVLIFHLFDVPRQARPLVAAALSAPALCLDVLTTTFFESWFPAAGGADDRAYAAMVLGGVGLILMTGIVMGRPSDGD